MQYMGAFYANALASGLVENGMCCVDSDEVLANVAKQKQDEDKERLNRSVAVDGLLTMQTQASKGKRKSFRKIWTLCLYSDVCHANKFKQILIHTR